MSAVAAPGGRTRAVQIIARSELAQILRNRAVLITSLLMPVAAGTFFVARRETFERIGSLGYVAAIVVFTIAGFSLYATAVTTLAARRQTLFLKRLRSTAADDAAILTGLVLPVTVISAVQVALILAGLAAASGGPDRPVLLAVAVVATFAMMLAFALATAGLTRSPEHAQVTTLPLSLGTVVVASWVGISGADGLAAVARALPGGSAAELVVRAWDGGLPLGKALLLLVPTLAWVALAVALARRIFRWEPRR